MKSLLDQLLDRMEAGTPPLVVFQGERCRFPLEPIPEKSWLAGCRCLRCREGHLLYNKQPRRTRRGRWTP